MRTRRMILIFGILGSLLAVPATAFGGWRQFSVPSPGTSPAYVELRSVSCFNLESSTAALCYAVGNYKETSISARATLVEKYTSAKGWEAQTSPNPAGATSSALDTVTCRTETECIAVGVYTNASGENLSLGEWLHSGSWTLDNPTSPPDSSYSQLTGVSCPVAFECMAVGDFHQDWNGYDVGLAYRWSAGTWSSPLYPLDPFRSISSGVGVDSCPSAACIAVNRSENPAHESETLAESVTASNVWGFQAAPSLAPATYSALYGLACRASVEECVADGTTNKSGKEQALVEWLKTSWALGVSAYPAGAQSSVLGTISCSAVCMAVGDDVSSGGVEEVMADYLYPTSAALAGPIVPSGSASHFEGISCTGEACMAVGDYTAGGVVQGLAERNW